jgi:dihydroorotate dehydrogenase electron transfer subunit
MSAAPIFPIQESLAPVIRNEPVNPEYLHMVVAATRSMLSADAGQFFHLRCPSGEQDCPLLRRPMSIFRIDKAQRTIEFLYKVTGAGTRGLARLKSGDTLNVFGPLGRGFSLSPEMRHVLIVARGVGMATMAPLAEAAIAQGARVTAILSARSADLVMSEDYLRSVGASTIALCDSDGASAVGEVESLIRTIHASTPIDLLTTCGSNRLLQLLKRLSAEFDVPGQIALEQLMGCAVGMCFCCVRAFRIAEKVTYRRVCCEGPVFDVRQTITW